MTLAGCRRVDARVNAPSRPCPLDVLRAAIRARHYSPRTEHAYAGWIRVGGDRDENAEFFDPKVAIREAWPLLKTFI